MEEAPSSLSGASESVKRVTLNPENVGWLQGLACAQTVIIGLCTRSLLQVVK